MLRALRSLRCCRAGENVARRGNACVLGPARNRARWLAPALLKLDPMSIDVLIGKQNPDGGWPYIRGASWTEPTVYSVLAMLAGGEDEAARRGLGWIARAQRPDGGFPPQHGIDESSWVTALVAWLPPQHLGMAAHKRAVQWLLGTTGEESTPLYRTREWLLGNPRPADQEFAGWPWIPRTAAWVGPTSIAILALEKSAQYWPSAELRERTEQGRRFLMARMCREGGWNHGSVRSWGYESGPYPETTGMALMALRGARYPGIELAVNRALSFLAECRSADALNWLRLGLLAHGQLPAGYCRPPDVACRTLPETSLEWFASRAQQGLEPFLA